MIEDLLLISQALIGEYENEEDNTNDKLDRLILSLQEKESCIQKLRNENQTLNNENQILKDLIGEKTKSMNESIIFIKRQDETLLQKHKENYEETIKRQLFMIETLIEDKKDLSDLVQLLQQDLKKQDQELEKERKMIDDKLKVQRESILTQEQIKREKWMKKKTVEIREITLKGLEPEIQKLIEKNEQQIKMIKIFYEKKLAELQIQ